MFDVHFIHLLDYTPTVQVFSQFPHLLATLFMLMYCQLPKSCCQGVTPFWQQLDVSFCVQTMLRSCGLKIPKYFLICKTQHPNIQIYVTSFSSISYYSNSEHWTQKCAQNGNVHSIILDVNDESQSVQNPPFLFQATHLNIRTPE